MIRRRQLSRAAIATLACGALALGAPQAMASGVLSSFTLTPAVTQAGGNPDITADLGFDYGGDTRDSVRRMTLDLQPGLLAAIANVPETCSLDQLRAFACPPGSQIGEGTVTTARDGALDTGLYLMAPPSPGDAAGFGTVVRAGGSPYTGLGTLDVVTVGGKPVGEVTLDVPVVSNVQVVELSATMNAGTSDDKPFTRLPTSCSTATSSASVETTEGNSGAGTDSFSPTGCGALGYAPTLSAVQATKDPGDEGVELVASLSEPNAATEAAAKALELHWPPASLVPNAGPDGACLTGTPCTIGTATATSPLAPASYLSGGTVTLGGSALAPTLTVAFPAPVPIALTGAVDLAAGAVTFANLPDFPLSAMTIDITGPAGGKALATTCAPGDLVAKLTPQSGGATVTSTQPIAYRGCPPPPRHSPPPPARPRVAIHGGRVLVVHHRAKVILGCSGGTARSSCRGKLSLTYRARIVRRVHRRLLIGHRTIALAGTSYAVASGRSRQVTLRLTDAGLRLLARDRDGRLRVRATATVRGGTTAHRTIVVQLAPPRRAS